MKRLMIAMLVVASIFTLSLSNSFAGEKGAVVEKISSIVKIAKTEKSEDAKPLITRIKSGVEATTDAVKDATDGRVATICEKCKGAVSKAKSVVAKVREKVSRN